MKKTLYIHIGRPKVGSSAIQHFLWLNQAALLEQGCYYPMTGEQHRASHGLSVTLQPNAAGVSKFQGVDPRDLYRELVQEINSQKKADRVVVSSENFYFVDPEKVEKLLNGKFNVKIICFVRRQDEVLTSSYIQELKEDKLKDDDINNYIRDPFRLKLIDYHETLTRWAGVFGRENIIVRPYEQEQFEGGDIFRDISHVIGLKISSDFQMPSGKVNPSPSSDVLEFIKLLNVMCDSRLIVKQLTRPLLEASEILPKEEQYDSKRLLTSAQRDSIESSFSSSNESVAREFLGRRDGVLFYQSSSTEEAIETTKEFTMQRFVTVMAKLFLTQQTDITKMNFKLDYQDSRIAALESLLAKEPELAREVQTALGDSNIEASDKSVDKTSTGLGSRFKRWFS